MLFSTAFLRLDNIHFTLNICNTDIYVW